MLDDIEIIDHPQTPSAVLAIVLSVLASVVASVIAGAVSVPFTIAGQIMLTSAASSGMLLFAAALGAVGRAVSQIITAPLGGVGLSPA